MHRLRFFTNDYFCLLGSLRNVLKVIEYNNQNLMMKYLIMIKIFNDKKVSLQMFIIYYIC